MARMKDKFLRKKQVIVTFALLAIFVLSWVISGCSAENNKHKYPDDVRVDHSFVTGQPCEAPCWYELQLGISTIDDIRLKLAQLPFVDESTLFESNIGVDGSKLGFHFNCVYYNPPGSCGRLEAENGKLSKVVLSVQYSLPLKSAIDRLGIPKYYTVDTSSTENNCLLNIYWPEKSIITVVQENSRKIHCSEIKTEPIDFDLQINTLIYVKINTQDEQNQEIRPWPNSGP
jgi:hypothetical protein